MNIVKKYLIILLIFLFINTDIAYAASDYTFKYTDEYEKEWFSMPSKNDIAEKDKLYALHPGTGETIEVTSGYRENFYVIDEEIGKFVKYSNYRKKYKKKYEKNAKLTRPKYPKEIKKLNSVLTAEVAKNIKKSKDALVKYTIKDFEVENDISITDLKAMKNYNLNNIKYIKKVTGINTNERYFEEIITNTLQYIIDKSNAQIHNKNNPYRKSILEVMNGHDDDNSDGIILENINFCYWLFYGKKIGSYKFDFDNYDYYRPYGGLISYKIIPFRSDKVKVLSLNANTLHNNSIIENNKSNKDYISEYNKEVEELQSEGDGNLKLGNKATELLPGNSLLFESYFIMGSYLYKAQFCYYKGEIVLYDIVPRTSRRISFMGNDL